MEANKTATPFACKDKSGMGLSPQGWSASHSSNDSTAYLPIYKKGKVVALVVARGDYDELVPEIQDVAATMTRACNAHDDLVTLLKACDNKLQAMCTYHSGPAAQSIHAFREKIAAALAKAGA